MFKKKDNIKIFNRILLVLSIIGIIINIIFIGKDSDYIFLSCNILYIIYYIKNHNKLKNIVLLQIIEVISILLLIGSIFEIVLSDILPSYLSTGYGNSFCIAYAYNVIYIIMLIVFSSILVKKYQKKDKNYYLFEIVLEIILIIMLLCLSTLFMYASIVAILFVIMALIKSINNYKKCKK